MIEAADGPCRGRDDLLDHSATITLEARSYPNGAHLAEVEVDPDTGAIRLDRYTVCDDFGTLLNPELVRGAGAWRRGAGLWAGHLRTRGHYDAKGQLLTASFMDYAMPRADDMPMMRFEPVPTPPPTALA
jgi:aerobic carbon-monoxide dehydrogenase large subunit